MACEQNNQEHSNQTDDEFIRSVADNDLNKIRELLESNADMNPRVSDDILSLSLISATEKGHVEMAELLLKQKGIAVNKKNAQGFTALDLAAQNNHLQIVRTLLNHENFTIWELYGPTSPIHLAAQNGHLSVVNALLQNRRLDIMEFVSPDSDDELIYDELLIDADRSKVFGERSTPLHLAAQNGHTEIVKFLRKIGAQTCVDKAENTPLHLSAREGHAEIVSCLLYDKLNSPESYMYISYDLDEETERRCVLLRNEDRMTPLHLASMRGHHQVVEILLGHDQVRVNSRCEGASTALHLAAEGDHSETIELLLEQPKIQNLKNAYRKTALDIAQEKGHWSCVAALKKRFKK